MVAWRWEKNTIKCKEQSGEKKFLCCAISNKWPHSEAGNKKQRALMFRKVQVYISGLAAC